jgi:hypothetical protein
MVDFIHPPDANRYPFLESEQALEQFLRQWKAGSLPKSAWTHAAHVAVAACLAFAHPPATAFELTRTGIIHFNHCVGTANTDTSGYHETLTRFWSDTVGRLVRGGGFPSRLAAVRSAVNRFGEARDHHRSYYSFDVVRDSRARREWIPPDRQPPRR